MVWRLGGLVVWWFGGLLIQVAYARPPTPSFRKDYIEWI